MTITGCSGVGIPVNHWAGAVTAEYNNGLTNLLSSSVSLGGLLCVTDKQLFHPICSKFSIRASQQQRTGQREGQQNDPSRVASAGWLTPEGLCWRGRPFLFSSSICEMEAAQDGHPRLSLDVISTPRLFFGALKRSVLLSQEASVTRRCPTKPSVSQPGFTLFSELLLPQTQGVLPPHACHPS